MLSKNKDFMNFRENFMSFQANIEKSLANLEKKQKTLQTMFTEKVTKLEESNNKHDRRIFILEKD